MIQAVGSSVLQLHRERVGELSLGELGLEEARGALSDDEVESALGYACRALDAPALDGYALLDSGDGRRLETLAAHCRLSVPVGHVAARAGGGALGGGRRCLRR